MKKIIVFCLFGFIAASSYSQVQNSYEEIINSDVSSLIEEYKTTDNSILLLEINYEKNNFMKLNELFTETASQATYPTDVLPIINQMYRSAVKCMAFSTLLYNNGNIKESNFAASMQLMKTGVILILQGAKDMGLDIDSIINYNQENIPDAMPRNYINIIRTPLETPVPII
ncbi:MAG: hypothetical protein LBL45_10975 [Treponema sp.]|jgi:hypothetical protein|nr:hypothetical protein [Treponema sp.]